MKLWLDVKHSTINRYFAFAVNEPDFFQVPQLHKHFYIICDFKKPDIELTDRHETTNKIYRVKDRP